MATEVILLSDVENLGLAGATVKVADGYARNYLLPKGLAGNVTPATLKKLEKLRKEREELARLQLAEARDKAAKIKALSITIRAKTVDGTKLYGSVTENSIVEAIGALGVAIDHSQVELPEAIHEVGQFDVNLKLHAEVSVGIKVWVVEA